MIYLKVKWIHKFENEPIWIYGELDEQRNEIRKIEVFSNGSMSYADACTGTETGRTRLAEVPWIDSQMIAADPQFQIFEIEKSEFDSLWWQCKSEA